MEDIERFIKLIQQKRLANQRELERLDAEPDEHKKLMKELRDLRGQRIQCKENITKHLNMITSHKHSVHKIVHSSKDISGLPVPHDCAQDVKTMFTDAIEFLNNMGDTYKILNAKENNINPLKLIQAVITCTEDVGKALYQTKCSIAQLETLKENIAVLQQHVLDSSDNTEVFESINLTNNGESTDSGSTIM
ncbi:uncharacterized protein LOC105429428 [Pogonomyrmex barbatus]|uniref:Uncharacterized protein LOC105429428 n=1 Tax=Pogonomyrmex barbatus TaxID=144034 RepID=A0A6I9X817_9HYME|nr:uncharacterized protein LOC105429428 [Pogonomyrmex barbatus]